MVNKNKLAEAVLLLSINACFTSYISATVSGDSQQSQQVSKGILGIGDEEAQELQKELQDEANEEFQDVSDSITDPKEKARFKSLFNRILAEFKKKLRTDPGARFERIQVALDAIKVKLNEDLNNLKKILKDIKPELSKLLQKHVPDKSNEAQISDTKQLSLIRELQTLDKTLPKLQALSSDRMEQFISKVSELIKIQKQIVLPLNNIKTKTNNMMLTWARKGALGAGKSIEKLSTRLGALVSSISLSGKRLTKNDQKFILEVNKINVNSLSQSLTNKLKDELTELTELSKPNEVLSAVEGDDGISSILKNLLDIILQITKEIFESANIPDSVDNSQLKEIHSEFIGARKNIADKLTYMEKIIADFKEYELKNIVDAAKDIDTTIMNFRIAMYNLSRNSLLTLENFAELQKFVKKYHRADVLEYRSFDHLLAVGYTMVFTGSAVAVLFGSMAVMCCSLLLLISANAIVPPALPLLMIIILIVSGVLGTTAGAIRGLEVLIGRTRQARQRHKAFESSIEKEIERRNREDEIPTERK